MQRVLEFKSQFMKREGCSVLVNIVHPLLKTKATKVY